MKYICIFVQTSPEVFSTCETETLYPLNNNSLLPLLPAPGNHHFTFCLCEFYCSRYISGIMQYFSFCDWHILHSTDVFKVHLFCSICQNFFPFSRLNNIPLYTYITFCLFIHLFMNMNM